MRIKYPGLTKERLPSGNYRYRVRAKGNPSKRTVLTTSPGQAGFTEEYNAARGASNRLTVEHSLDWLVDLYLDDLKARVDAGLASPLTYKQRRSQLRRVCAHPDRQGGTFGKNHMNAPKAAFVDVRDAMRDTPSEADNTIKSVRALYTFAMTKGLVVSNPAQGIDKIAKPAKGAVPWTRQDLKRFKEHHPPGTMAHRAITLFVFSGCRIGDAIWLGTDQEIDVDGEPWLAWQPTKRGSPYTEIPILPPLREATRGAEGIYLRTAHGRPFRSPEGLRNRMGKWCDAAGVAGRTSHGIRKAFGEMLAEAGATQHGIMALMSHTQASTSEVYTKGAQRRILAASAMKAVGVVDW